MNDQQTLRSFWDRKEGSWGYAVIGLFIIGGLALLKIFLPVLVDIFTLGVTALGKLWMLTFLATGLGAFLWVLFCTKLPRLVGYWFKASVRRLAGTFTSIYPIEIMEEFIAKMKVKKQEFSEKKTEIRKQQRVLEETIKQNDHERRDALARVDAAAKRGMEMEVTLAARQAGRLEELNSRHTASLGQVTLLGERLQRVEQVCDFKIRDMENQKKALKQEFEISKKTKGAISAAKAILSGTDPDQELYDRAVEFVIEDSRATMGLVDDFMSSTESILNGVDLQNGMWEEKALAQIAELEQKEKMLIGRSPQMQQLTPRTVDAPVLHVLPSSDYSSKYFG
jgi:hypothetical protein